MAHTFQVGAGRGGILLLDLLARDPPDGPCYGCGASHLQRTVAEEPPGPAPDYSAPGGPVAEATVPASKASIGVIASLHAVVTLEVLETAGINPAAHPEDRGER